MASDGLVPDVLSFAVAMWLGAYVIGRDPRQPRLWLAGLALASYAAARALGAVGSVAASPGLAGSLNAAIRAFIVAPLLAWTVLVIGLLVGHRHPSFVRALAAALAILVTSAGLLFLPFDPMLQRLLVILIGVELAAMGVAVAARDAAEEGERLLLDAVRSMDASIVLALIFGGQVALAMALGLGESVLTVALLLATVAAAIVVQTFSDRVQAMVDAIAFGRLERLRQARADLRATTTALPKTVAGVDLAALDDQTFARLTRRALSQYGNLPRLATSPLIYLPEIGARLRARGADDNPLERAAELKGLLSQSVARLKPRTPSAFGASDEWRHYNALYFPYVVGLKPYSRGRRDGHADSATRDALAWFQTFVPERTLYNWQKAAAEMVARDLRSGIAASSPPN